jgi:hypothetical protein
MHTGLLDIIAVRRVQIVNLLISCIDRFHADLLVRRSAKNPNICRRHSTCSVDRRAL